MSTPSTTVLGSVKNQLSSIVTNARSLPTTAKNYLQANKNTILKGVAITAVVAGVPAALFFFAPAALLSVGSLALSLFAVKASVTATLAVGAALVATGVAALVGSTVALVNALAKFVGAKLEDRKNAKRQSAKRAAFEAQVNGPAAPATDKVIELGYTAADATPALEGIDTATAVAKLVTVMAATAQGDAPAQGVYAVAEGDAAEQDHAAGNGPRQ